MIGCWSCLPFLFRNFIIDGGGGGVGVECGRRRISEFVRMGFGRFRGSMVDHIVMKNNRRAFAA